MKLAKYVLDSITDSVKSGYNERMDPMFTGMVHLSSIDKTSKALKNIDPDSMSHAILRTYNREMMLQNGNMIKFLTTAEGFDRMSYAIFTFFFENVEGDLKKNEKDVTAKIGDDLFDYVNPFIKDNSLIGGMEEICDRLTGTGYYRNAAILTSVEGKDKAYNLDLLKLTKGEKTHIGYVMDDPVILPSATQLFSKYGCAQHFSSRILQSYLKNRGYEGKEIDFDPRDHQAHNVAELWELRKVS